MHAKPYPVYQPLRDAMAAQYGAARFGDPAAVGHALLQIVDAENPPLRVLFGSQGVDMVKHVYAQRLQTWADWAHVSHAAQG